MEAKIKEIPRGQQFLRRARRNEGW